MSDRFGITDELVEHIKKQEQLVLKPYLCPAGYPTIGYGRRIPSMKHEPITEETAERWLIEDIAAKRDALLAISPMLRGESERRVAALIDFCFNCGEGAYKRSTLRKRVEERNWEAAAQENAKWVYAKGQKLRGLVKRREVTSAWLREG